MSVKDMAEVSAAPFMPYLGMKMKFKIIFVTAPDATIFSIMCSISCFLLSQNPAASELLLHVPFTYSF